MKGVPSLKNRTLLKLQSSMCLGWRTIKINNNLKLGGNSAGISLKNLEIFTKVPTQKKFSYFFYVKID
jgi:hypothetical protein